MTGSRTAVERKSTVSFGTTLDRGVFPVNVPNTRFGNELCPIRGAPNRGPGAYDDEKMTNFEHNIEALKTSEKGYTLGARTAQRFHPNSTFINPPPCAYQKDQTELRTFSPAYKPFHAAAERFPVYQRDIDEITPGAGTYEHEVNVQRKVQWHDSFGSGPINLPAVKQQSTINKNTEKLMSTKDEKKYHRRLAYLKLYY